MPLGIILGLDETQVKAAVGRSGLIKHVKGGVYKMLSFVEFKLSGTWYSGARYQDVESGLEYVREFDGFGKFVTLEEVETFVAEQAIAAGGTLPAGEYSCTDANGRPDLHFKIEKGGRLYVINGAWYGKLDANNVLTISYTKKKVQLNNIVPKGHKDFWSY